MPCLINYSNVLKGRPYKANVFFDCLSYHLLINISHANIWKGLITVSKINVFKWKEAHYCKSNMYIYTQVNYSKKRSL